MRRTSKLEEAVARGVVVACLMSAAVVARAQEPDLHVRKDGADGVVVDVLPDAALPDPLAWNLYRGRLEDVAASIQHGDPDGRCDVPGTQLAIALAGELSIPGDYYYLLTAVPSAGAETGLGAASDGVPRVNSDPCPVGCGTEVVPPASVTGTEGIVIGPDGTLYYSQSQAVGRRLPGAAAVSNWVSLPGANTVWGLALRGDGMLFVGSPTSGGNVYRIDTTLASPTAQVHFPAAGGANGLTIGPDGALYYSDFFGGRVYRVDDAGVRTQVTTSAITNANGLLFDDDGTLIVLAYTAAQVWRLTLGAGMVEIGRFNEATLPVGSRLDGIAKDVLGRFYLGDNGANARLIRVDDAFGNIEVLLTGVSAAANIAFGKGALDCLDVYVASSGQLRSYQSDATGRP